jgi:cobalt-zinc-cadmium efflux system membrane fusion protein
MTGTNMFLRTFIVLLSAAIANVGCTRGGSADVRVDSSPQKKPPTEVVLPLEEQADSMLQVEVLETTNEPQRIQAPGKITLTDSGIWRVGVLTSGRIETVTVNLGDPVREGQILARMHSHDVHEARAAYQTARSDLSRAEAAATLAQKNYERAERLYSLKAGSLGEADAARQEVVNAQAEVRDKQVAVEKERIHLEGNLGVAANPGPDVSEEAADQIPIRAPGSGYILTKNITPGTVVDPTKDLFVIGDLKRVWMIASVAETNLAELRVGQPATITTAAFPTDRFKGKVTNLAVELDPVTRVVRVRIDIDNPSMKLRPEMLGTSEIEVGGTQSLLLVPREALQQVNEQDVVFVRKSEDRFEIRPVHLGDSVNGKVIVLEGIKAGEAVVARGSFLLKSQLLKSSLESD